MALEKELETYRLHRERLLADEGKFVVIHGESILGVFTSYEDALKAGYEKCKLEPFLVKKIQAVDPVHFISRDIKLACPTSPSV
jgi:hypothetical protein